MTTAQVVETSVTVNDNSPIQDYVNPDDQTQPTFEMTPGFKPFTVLITTFDRLQLLIVRLSISALKLTQKLTTAITEKKTNSKSF